MSEIAYPPLLLYRYRSSSVGFPLPEPTCLYQGVAGHEGKAYSLDALDDVVRETDFINVEVRDVRKNGSLQRIVPVEYDDMKWTVVVSLVDAVVSSLVLSRAGFHLHVKTSGQRMWSGSSTAGLTCGSPGFFLLLAVDIIWRLAFSI